jgi:alkylation response protein AidB-like acyl-CoA dehydrogenase
MASWSNGTCDRAEPARAGLTDRSALASIVVECVNPDAGRRDRDLEPLDRSIFAKVAATGILGASLPPAIGGGGADWRRWGQDLRQLAYLAEELALPFTISIQQSIAKQLLRSGRPELIERYVRPMMRGELFGSFCWTEGTDPFSFRTTAALGGGECVLSGRKSPVSVGVWADFFLVYARDSATEDVVVVLVERSDPGVSIERCTPMGLRSSGQATLRFDHATVPSGRLLIASDGIGHGQLFLNERRISLACMALGKLEALFEAMVANLTARRRHRLPMTEMQGVQAGLGRCWAALEAIRAMVDRMLRRVSRDQESCADSTWDPTVAVTKHFVLEQMSAMLGIAQQLLGGSWYYDDEPFGRWMRDLQGFVPAAGIQGILEVDLGIWATAMATPGHRQAAARRRGGQLEG